MRIYVLKIKKDCQLFVEKTFKDIIHKMDELRIERRYKLSYLYTLKEKTRKKLEKNKEGLYIYEDDNVIIIEYII